MAQHILHINNNFSGNRVHSVIVKKIAEKGVLQTIYVPLRNANLIGKNLVEHPGVKIVYAHILKKHDRIFYRHKIKKIAADIEQKTAVDTVSHIHAHTLFSDGGAAYRLSMKYDIPFSVSVRNTDLTFFKYFKHLKKWIEKVLEKADKIVMITPIIEKRMYAYLSPQFIQKIAHKVTQIANPIDDVWFEQANIVKRTPQKEVRLIQVGVLDDNKNHISVLNALKELKSRDFSYEIVGSGAREQMLQDFVRRHDMKTVCFSGYIKDPLTIQQRFRQADIFIMPSKFETFGVVYAEAIACGLPVIYSKGTGVDGLFHNEVGCAVDPKSPQEIVQAIETICQRYEKLSQNCLKEAVRFKAELCADRYLECFSKKGDRIC